MLDLARLTDEEKIIFLKELEQLKGCSNAQEWAERAVLRHRDLREGRLKVGQGHVEDPALDIRFSQGRKDY